MPWNVSSLWILVKRNVLSSENTEGERMRRERLYGRWTNNKLWINEEVLKQSDRGFNRMQVSELIILYYGDSSGPPWPWPFAMNRKSLSVCRKQSRLNVTLTQGKKSLIIEHSDMHLHTNNKAMGAGNLIPKSSGKIFQYYSTSVISFINGVMFLSMSGFFFFDICRELSHQWPWDWQICLGTWSWARESVWVSFRLPQMIWWYSMV